MEDAEGGKDPMDAIDLQPSLHNDKTKPGCAHNVRQHLVDP